MTGFIIYMKNAVKFHDPNTEKQRKINDETTITNEKIYIRYQLHNKINLTVVQHISKDFKTVIRVLVKLDLYLAALDTHFPISDKCLSC